eukprot:1798678-Amphidinium_carterae.1
MPLRNFGNPTSKSIKNDPESCARLDVGETVYKMTNFKNRPMTKTFKSNKIEFQTEMEGFLFEKHHQGNKVKHVIVAGNTGAGKS